MVSITKRTALAGVMAILLTTIIILFLVPNSPVQTYLMEFMEWIQNIPVIIGSITLMIMYAIAMVFLFPGTPFNLAAGFLYGVWLGAIVTVVGCDLGASLSFLISRTLGREWAQEQVSKNKRFSMINLAVEKNAWLIICLIRLSPVLPFGLCNYIFGVTKVPFTTYWTATTLGLIPCTVAYTYLGSLMRDLSDIYAKDSATSSSSTQTTIIALAVVFTLLGIVIITAVTKRTLDKTMKEQQYGDDAPTEHEDDAIELIIRSSRGEDEESTDTSITIV
eukprot:TRINITY_DN4334_c0_g1_i1.p1 TRINITY_DN4334_c0_g1~~TRINITY_DN4334_c0_g1_i1.p1  ORF type:complete len:277 (-),score=52.55 TRINITY_DN4334_c0_g1_i1:282-1112(-)